MEESSDFSLFTQAELQDLFFLFQLSSFYSWDYNNEIIDKATLERILERPKRTGRTGLIASTTGLSGIQIWQAVLAAINLNDYANAITYSVFEAEIQDQFGLE